MRSIKFISVIVLFISITSYGQNYSVTHFNESNGFNASTIYGISQDNQGFLWIGTNSGLVRYDGISFKYYGLKDGLVDLDVFYINIDSKNHIYLHNFSNQLNYFYKGIFFNSKDNSDTIQLPYSNIPIAAYDKKNDCVLISSPGETNFSIIKLNEGLVSSVNKMNLSDDSKMSGICELDSVYYVFSWNEKDETTVYESYKGDKKLNSGNVNVRADYYANCGDYICLSELNILKFYKRDKSFKLTYSHEIKKRLHSNKGELWVTLLEGGIVRIKEASEIEYFNMNETVNYGYMDRDSNLWIGTDGNGLFYYKKNKKHELHK